MNREIKFEVQIKHIESGNLWTDVFTIDDLLNRNGCLFSPSIQEVVFKRQFTGLLDKNGKEIYEGDILKGWFYVSIGERIKGSFAVVYNQPWAAFGVENECAFVTIGNSECEIIGNIYENPELVNG